MNDDLSGFDGVARLFPLPNLVLFPHVVQPLHIFEPRYRQMTADAIAGDRLIALALLDEEAESEQPARPELHAIACLARIVAYKELDDGRYIILVRGVSRVRILDELDDGKLYRSARVELVDEVMVRRMGGPGESDPRKDALKSWLFSLKPPASIVAPASSRRRASAVAISAFFLSHSEGK